MPKEIKPEELAEIPQTEHYEQRPIENYGLSLLQSMGFTKEGGIGKNKQNALKQLYVLKPRPRGLGLGAQDDRIQEKPKFTKGDFVLITKGLHKTLTGIILNVLEASLLIELSHSQSKIEQSFDNLKTITKEEFDQHQPKEQEPQQKSKIKWIIPGIRVKVVSPKSPLYLQKVIVTDLISKREFQCLHQTESGNRIYKDLSEKDVQTFIPKIGGTVIILKGQHKNQRAQILQRDKKRERVMVQTENELELLTLREGDISEYIEL